MTVTVAICTWNRAALLDKTLARMRELASPGVEWELLVVNNNSFDDTDAIIEKHAAALPLRRLLETKQGLSNARNCAIENARGDFLIWTDDDVLVDTDWLSAYVAAEREHPDAQFFGGPVEPWFEVEPPAWVKRNLALLDGPFALRQLGGETRMFVGPETPYGANMAFRTAALKKYRFDPALGRIGTGMLSGEETALIERIRADGGSGIWVAPARVRHFIPAARLTAKYVWKFFHGLGRTQFRERGANPAVPRLFGAERWAVRNYLAARARSLLLAPWGGRGWLNSFTAAAVARGVIDESRAAARGPA